MLLDDITRAVEAAGLRVFGGFRPRAQDGVPPLADGTSARTVLMVGNAGPAMWRRFWAERVAGPHPLDAWTRTVLTAIAEAHCAVAVFPFQQPYLPFQSWATRAEPSHISPLGLLIHPEFGLWYGLRGALLFAEDLGVTEAAPTVSPCEPCQDKPCLRACPVQAFSQTGYDVPSCVTRLLAPEGADCMDLGCLARHACPVGRDYRYDTEQARFHMEAFRLALGEL